MANSKDLDEKLKRIMPNICDSCKVGIGKSVLLYEGVWRQYSHEYDRVHIFRHKGKKYRLCEPCFKKAQRDPSIL